MFAQVFRWGNSSKLDITKHQIDTIIKKYVDKNYPKLVLNYKNSLRVAKQKEIEKYNDITTIDHNLMWEDKKTTIANNFNILESKIYCRKLKLANHNDWRIPRYKELLGLVDYARSNPATISKLSYVASDKYWSISQNIETKNNYWFVDFTNGNTNFESKDKRNKLRCVREISKQKSSLEKKINIVLDKQHNIMWQDTSDAKDYFVDFVMAKVYCETLILNGYTNWRMANIRQLETIIDITKKQSKINSNFRYIKKDKYWSNNQNIEQKKNYWFVDFQNAKVSNNDKNNKYLVRCLRDIK